MTRACFFVLVLAAGPLGAATARADALDGAAGLSVSWQQRRDYGEATREAFVPELVGLFYLDTTVDRLYLRPGARLGYGGLQPPDMPAAVQVREHDIVPTAELGAVYDGPIVPSLTLGAGLAIRQIRLTSGEDVDTDGERISRFQALPLGFAQLGVGIPMARGRVLLEPFARLEVLAGDRRARHRYGLDVTVAWPASEPSPAASSAD